MLNYRTEEGSLRIKVRLFARSAGAGWAAFAIGLMVFLAVSSTVRVGHAYSTTPTMSVTSGLNCPGQIAFNSGTMYITNYASGSSGYVAELASPYTGTPSVLLSSFTNAWSVAFDSAGNMWVSGYAGAIYGYAAPYTGSPFKTISVAAISMAFDSSGNLWVSTSTGQLLEFASSSLAGSGTLTSSNAAVTASTGIFYGMAFDSNGNLWGTSTTGPSSSKGVEEVAAPITDTSTGTMTVTETNGVGGTYYYPYGIAFDSSGNMWVIDYSGDAVYEYASPYTGAPIFSITSGLNRPYDVTASGANIWVSNCGNSSISEYAGSSSNSSSNPNLPLLTISSGLSYPGKLAFDSSGNLYVPSYGSGQVLEFTAPYTGTPTVLQTVVNAWEVGFDSSGNLWVMAYDGSIYGYHAPYTGAAFETISMSADGMAFNSGNLWVSAYSTVYEFTASALSGSGTITTANAAITLTPSSPVYTLAFDSNGNLWGAEACTGALLKFAAPITSSSTGTSVTLQGSGGLPMYCPWGISFDSSGNMWIGNYDSLTGYSPQGAYEYSAPYTGSPIKVYTNASSSLALSAPYYAIVSGSNVWVSDYSNNAIYEYRGFSQATQPPNAIPPGAAPTKYTLTTGGGSSVTGNLVSLDITHAVYNFPSINQTLLSQELAQGNLTLLPSAVSDCSITIHRTAYIRVSGFFSSTWGGGGANSTEFVFSDYQSFLTPAQGWPSEPACS